LLREGLDIPEVALVAILDADKEGFLRNYTSLIQTFGRAARNVDGSVILYADTTTKSIKQAIEETARRRAKQIEYNKLHDITPKTIIKSIPDQVATLDDLKNKTQHDLSREIIEIETQMKKYAEELDFENAIACRDRLRRIQVELEKKNAR
jgi:excinuclease ABC subunit B